MAEATSRSGSDRVASSNGGNPRDGIVLENYVSPLVHEVTGTSVEQFIVHDDPPL